MSPPSSNDSSVAPPPPPFQPSASISDINNNISHSSPVLPAGITNRPTSPQHASNHQLPFTSTAPLPSVIPSPPCQPPSSPIHQSQPRARVRSRTPPLSLRPSHFATSIIPQNTRRRLRLRRSLSNAPILSTPQPSALTRPVSASQQHQPPVDSSAIIITQSQTNNPILSEINNQDNNVGNNGNILPSWNMPQPNSTLSPNRNYNNINNHNNSTNDNNNNMNNNSNNDNDNSTSTNFVNTTSNLSPPNLSTPHNDNIPNIVSTSTSHLPPRSLHSLAHSSSPSTVTTTPTSIPQPNHSSSLLTSHPSTQYASPQEPLASAGRNSVVSPYATPHIPSISSSATTPTPSNSAPTITPANDSNGNTAPRTIPRSSAIDELIAVLERNAPQIPPVRSNVISRTVSFQQDHQLSQQQQQSPQQPQAHHVSPGTRQVSNNDSDSCNLSRKNLPSFPDTPSGNASSNPDHSLHSTLPPQVATEAPGLACISTPHPQIAGTTNLQNASMDGITTSAPQPTIPSTHSDFHRPSSPFFPIPDSTSASTGVHTPFVASNRPRWIQTRSQNPPPSGTTTVPSLTSLPQPSHPPAAPLFSAPRLSAGNSNNYSNSNSNNTNNESNANNSFRASTGSSAGAGSSAGTGSGYGPPPGVPPSLWPMPPLTSLNESGSSLPPIVTVAGPMHRGISPYRSSIRHAHLSRRTSRPVSTPRTEAAPGPPHPLTMRSNHPAPTPPPPFLHPGGITGNQSSNHPNFSARTFTAPSLISVERQAASEPDNIFLSAQGSGIPSVRRVSGSANPVIDDDDDSMEHDRVRSRDRERLRDIDRDTDRCRESNRRFGDMVADDELIGIGTSINSAGGPRTGFGASPSSTAANEGFGAGSSGRRSVSFNIDSFPQYDGREGEEVSAANATANASEPHNSNGMGFIQDGASEGEQMRRARMSRILRMMGRSPRRVAQVSDDMRLIFGNEEESGLSGDEMHPSRMRSGSAYSGALSVPASSAHTADTGNNQGGASGSAVGSGGVSVMEGRNSMDGMRSLMVSDDDSDVMMMGELETMEYLHSLHALHGRHRERDRERDRNRDRDREIERERFISSSLRGRGRGGIRGTARISRLPPIESMLRRCEVRAMVAGREFGVPCGLFEYSVRGRPSLTPNIDWPDVVLIMDENVKPRAPILDLMAQDHVQWCVRVGPLGNGEGDGRRGYQGFVNGLIEGGFAIEIEVARGMIYFWALTFPPHGQCLLGVFRPNSRTTANASSGVANVNAAQASTTEITSAPTVPMVTTTTGAS